MFDCSKTSGLLRSRSWVHNPWYILSAQLVFIYLYPSYSFVRPFGKNFNFNCSKYRNPRSVESPQGSKYLFDLMTVRWPDGATETQWTLGVFQCSPVLHVAKSPLETRWYTFPPVTWVSKFDQFLVHKSLHRLTIKSWMKSVALISCNSGRKS